MRVNDSTGTTKHFILDIPSSYAEWREIESSPEQQMSITAITLNGRGTEATVTAPVRFRTVAYSGEVCRNESGEAVADHLTICADEVQLDVVLYRGRPVVRVDLRRMGRPRHLVQFERRSDNGR